MDERPTDPLPTRLSLLARVKDLDDSASWAEFFQTYERLVRGLARKRGLTDNEAEDVAQEVFKRLARTIHEFNRGPHAGSFRKWLGRLTRWRAEDKLRERRRLPVPLEDGGNQTDRPDLIASLPSPENPNEIFEHEARAHLLDTLLKRLESSVPARDLQIFQLIAVEGMSPDRVAAMFHLKRSYVYVLKHRIMEKLRVEAEKLPFGRDGL